MIKFIGKINREESLKGIRQNTLKLQNIFVSLILLFPIIYLLFEYGVLKSDITESGVRQATCNVTYSVSEAQCSGFLVSENGLVITAAHCVSQLKPGEQIFLSFNASKNPNYRMLPAEIVFAPDLCQTDPYNCPDDFAVLKLNDPIDIEPHKIAKEVDDPDNYNPSVTCLGYEGEQLDQDPANAVRVYNRRLDSTTFEINEIYKGMSGGPVIDNNTKEVIGIIAAKRAAGDREGISIAEKIQQVFTDPRTSHINW